MLYYNYNIRNIESEHGNSFMSPAPLGSSFPDDGKPTLKSFINFPRAVVGGYLLHCSMKYRQNPFLLLREQNRGHKNLYVWVLNVFALFLISFSYF